ncbi:uncharacterized protein FIBRA_07962 [Fibroporia radiculosa]|uniref:S-methyl-5'-thioadenosine phosphorylase n=1 Tax=Fibroporia radiculosa TaxID=599839 RepID=J4GVX5_9APHY|nr:uncharacterized protein FIBRA_07962 [Fibroporia radiculosa]CCM05730.1 predicted protein [Fibroporia radiculosa]
MPLGTHFHSSLFIGTIQGIAPRESTPSPSFRERQRAAKAHSMPNVPSVAQALATQNSQAIYPPGQQPSPTISNSSQQSRRTPPPTSRISPVASKMSVSTHARERSPERLNSPPPLVHSHSQPIIPHLIPLPPGGPHHSQSQPNVLAQVAQNPHHPRPINRVPPPQFLTQYQGADEKWQMTEELMAEIERADLQQAQGQFSHPAGTSGVAYAGGAASSGLSLLLQHSMNPAAKDPAVERVRAGGRSSPKEQDNGSAQAAKRQVREKEAQNARESPKTRDRSQTVSSISSLENHSVANRTPEYRGSPQYQTPMASPGERTAAYTQYVSEGYQSGNAQGPTPPALRKPALGSAAAEAAATRSTPPATSKLAASSHTPPLQAMATRPPDRSLPVQEEPEEDVGHYVDHDPEYEDRHSPIPTSEVYPEAVRYEARREHKRAASNSDDDEDDMTLNEEVDDEHLQQGKNSEESETGSGYTPRSPSVNLPDRTMQYVASNGQYSQPNGQYAQVNGDYQKTVRAKHRSGSTDQLGMRSFDPTLFEHTVNSLRSSDQSPSASTQRPSAPQQQSTTQPQQLADLSRQQAETARQYAAGRAGEQRMVYPPFQPPLPLPPPDELQSVLEDPTSSYIRSYLQTPGSRPNAPIPPTPHSQTAAPSPLISAIQSEIETRPIGSPYPYPFTHIRRTAIAAAQQAPSSSFDINSPEFIREQIQRQLQVYAMNNGLPQPQTDSTFSPPATPFPAPGYYPYPFLPMMGMQGTGGHGGAAGSTMSIRSSPSHEPVQLPPPPAMRGRGLRKRETAVNNLRPVQGGARTVRRVKPPPRVESTQPRETSPEPSSGSGEETAGEERFVDQYVAEANAQASWVNGNGHGNVNGNGNGVTQQVDDDDGEWVDEEEEGEEEDLLELEYHPTYVNNTQKRRRRWDTRWDALSQAFQALDRETDATLILLAAPSHSTKLHALTSRSIRRDAGLLNSPKLATIRGSFNYLAAQRRNARSLRPSLVERLQLSAASTSSADGSPGAGGLREEELRRALEVALGSLVFVGVIGGSGLYHLDNLTFVKHVNPETPWGYPSSPITICALPSGTQVAFLARHGIGHSIAPSTVPARANIAALKSLGVRAVLAFSAVGSLREEVAPGDFVLPMQIIDRTKGVRPASFFEGTSIVAHAAFGDPFANRLVRWLESRVRRVLDEEAVKAEAGKGPKLHTDKCIVCMEGPQFSTRAESQMYRAWGADVINMSVLPEAKLAREAELSYALIATATDYDSWRPHEASVTAAEVFKILQENARVSRQVAATILEELHAAAVDGDLFSEEVGSMQYSIMPRSGQQKEEDKKKLAYILPAYFS